MRRVVRGLAHDILRLHFTCFQELGAQLKRLLILLLLEQRVGLKNLIHDALVAVI